MNIEKPKSLSPEINSLETKKIEKGLKNADYWLSQIDDAMEMLNYHGFRQKTSEGICVDPVHKAINQLGDAIEALQKLGHDIPRIDLTGLPKEFILSMDIHPATAKVAKWFEQMEWKDELTKKWGTKEERAKRLTNSQSKKKLP